MAVGDIYNGLTYTAVKVLEGNSATNSPPSGGSAGVAIPRVTARTGCSASPMAATLDIWGTSGSTKEGLFRLWLYSAASAQWYPAGQGATATKGAVNGGVHVGAVHATPVDLPSHYDRVYLERLTLVGGDDGVYSAQFKIDLYGV